MKRSIVNTLAASGLLLAVLAPVSTYAANGVIQFRGDISDTTCAVGVSSPTGAEVKFGTVKPDAIIAGTAPALSFDINVGGGADCTNGKKAVLSFDRNDVDLVSNNVPLYAGGAGNVQIEISNSANGVKGDKVLLGQVGAVEAEIVDNAAKYSYFAQYVRRDNAAPVTPGDGSARLNFTVNVR
ncbi:fimbrial protein [Achromobacter kerstersii]|uniref:fimbrial protein n=1 Tax=Achromobacter kerstersii TaxID=1353890 RepID=UPI003D012593